MEIGTIIQMIVGFGAIFTVAFFQIRKYVKDQADQQTKPRRTA